MASYNTTRSVEEPRAREMNGSLQVCKLWGALSICLPLFESGKLTGEGRPVQGSYEMVVGNGVGGG